jgi:DNA polymerase (family 10)
MFNQEFAKALEQLAEIVEFEGSKNAYFRVRALRSGADLIRSHSKDLSLLSHDELTQIKGIGQAIADKAIEFSQTGKIAELEKLKKDLPPGIFDILKVPSLGPKRAKLIYDSLGVSDLDQLKKAIEKGKVQELEGLGEKSAQKIKRGIELVKKTQERKLRGKMLPKVQKIIAELKKHFKNSQEDLSQIEIAGSLRRGSDTVHDGDILVASKNPNKVISYFCNLAAVTEVLAEGETKGSVILDGGYQVDLRVVAPDSWGSALCYFTGSKGHNITLRQRAIKRGLKLSEWGVFKGEKNLASKTEKAVYQALGLPWIAPEIRENNGEIEAAENNNLPKLIRQSDLKGDLHLHTKESDGHSSLEEIIEKAINLNYQYLAITDHSQSAYVANGLNEERLLEQFEQIQQLRKQYSEITILWGTECDILSDGNLDYPEEILAKFDLVIGSIHSGLEKDVTTRLLKAMDSPYLTFIAHPTGRLLDSREGVSFNREQVFTKAAAKGVAMEISANYRRLDLSPQLANEAKSYGVKLVINTDAHHANYLDAIHYGITVAKRAWLSSEDVLNTLDRDALLDFLDQKHEQ